MIMSRLLQDGKKSLARRLFYESMEHVERLAGNGPKPTGTDPVKTTEAAVSKSTSTEASSVIAKAIDGSPSSTQNGLKIFQQAVLNVTPVVEVKSRRVGGSNYQVPLEVNSERGTALALRWLVQAARQRPGREMAMKLASEFIDASNKTGNAIRKREETHKMAEANKAFANYRF
jgi:small subunit ribosomal protein S7